MYAITNYDGTLKDDRYETSAEAVEALCGKYLLSGYDVVEVNE